MPSRDEVLREVVTRVRTLDARVAALETALVSQGVGSWDEPFTTDVVMDTAESVQADRETEDPEPPVSQSTSTPEQIAEYKAWVRRQADRKAREGAVYQEGDDIIIKGPTDRQKAVRRQIAARVGWENWTQDPRGGPVPLPKEGPAAYVAGGLAWLYYYDRNFCLEQLPATIQAMLIDMAETDPETAAEIAADLLKDQSPSGGTAVAEDNAKAQWDR